MLLLRAIIPYLFYIYHHTICVEKDDRKRSFGKSAVLLAIIGVLAKFIGALYRVPLTNIVGAEGMGLYQMVFPLYTVLLALCGGGIASAVSRVVAKYTALGDDGAARRVLRVAIVPLIGFSVVCTAGLILLRNIISGMQGNPDAAVAYIAICPSLLFAGGINIFRGYFQGKSNMVPSGISQLFEQIIKLVLGLYLSRRLLPYGLKYAVAGALIGVTASELTALIYLGIRYAISVRKKVRYIDVRAAYAETSAEFVVSHADDKTLRRELYAFAMSVTLGSLVLPVTQMIDSALVINLLVYGGATRADATALFGLFVGPVGTLINMPTVVVVSIAIAFLPAITSAATKGEDAGKTVRSAANWIMLLVIPVTAVFLLFPDRVVGALYTSGLTEYELDMAARLLRVQALSVFYIGVLQLSTAILQGYNKAHRPVINLVIGACVKVALTPLLVRACGIVGAAGATAACYAIAATLSTASAYKCNPFCASIADAFIKPISFTLIGAGAFWGCCELLKSTSLSMFFQTAIAAAVFAVVYGALVLSSGALGSGPHILKMLKKKKM